MEILHYNLDFFHKHSFSVNNLLCDAVKAILDDLDSKILIPEDEGDTPQLFRVNNDRKLRRVNSGGSYKGGSKQSQRNNYASGNNYSNHAKSDTPTDFKVTKIEKKEGIDKYISDMRGRLNRLSTKNYDTHRDSIIEDLHAFMVVYTDPTDILKLLTNMFTIMSSNLGLSAIYADLFVELVGISETFGNLVDEFVETYRTSVREIHYIDPDVDYDGFCDYNKLNDTRKCHAWFIIHLTKRDMISHESVLTIIQEFQETVKKYIDEVGRENDVEEITENIALLVIGSKSILKDTSEWKDVIQPNIHYFMGLQVKDHVSFTSRARFKYMDCK